MVADGDMTIEVSGGAPWGFRLSGGGQESLRVSKIRKRSKAEVGGLKEGDVLVSVNGKGVEGSSHIEAMETIDSAGDRLSLGVNRRSEPYVEIPVVMQQSLSMQSDPGDRRTNISDHTALSQTTSDGTRITLTSSEVQRFEVDPKNAEENKRAMRERYTISNVFVEKPDFGPKVRSEENIRSVPPNTPMFSSMVTAQLKDNTDPYDKENVSPQTDHKIKQIPVFNVRKIAVQSEAGPEDMTDGIAMHRSLDGGLNAPAREMLQGTKRGQNRVPVFGPQVEISLKDQAKNGLSMSDPSLKKKQFSDSAFYDDATSSYPTIEEQMKLCRAISNSLTASANQKARGARMFAKRQKRSPFWVHEGPHSGPSSDFSSEGEFSSLEDLDSELSVEEGGDKPLFQFRIPKLAQQVAPVDTEPPKMSLSRSQFEELRLNQQRCEHNAVSPVTCFNLAADLQSSKGRGAKIFEKRRQRAEQWVIDDENVKKSSPPVSRLQNMIDSNQQNNGAPTPWDVVSRNQNMYANKQTMYNKPNNVNSYAPAPVITPISKIANLSASNKPVVLEGPKFNRVAKGWSTVSEDLTIHEPSPVQYIPSVMTSSQHSATPPAPPPKPQYRDYNSRSRGWQPAEPTLHQLSDNYNTYPRSRRNQPVSQQTHVSHTSQNTSYHSYPSDFMIVGTDL